jgi:hypothetical protein
MELLLDFAEVIWECNSKGRIELIRMFDEDCTLVAWNKNKKPISLNSQK